MTPTAWDFRNKLLAILNGARHNGKPYVDLESDNLFAETGGDPNSKRRISVCHDVMTRMIVPVTQFSTNPGTATAQRF